MIIFDWHLDLAWNALEWNRDLNLPVTAIRQREVTLGYQGPGRGTNTVSLDALRRGKVAVVSATILARHDKLGGQLSFMPKSGYDSAEAAYAAAIGQLAYYRALDRHGHIRIIHDWPSFFSHVEQWHSVDTGQTHETPPPGCIISMEGADPVLTPDDLEDWWQHGLRILSLSHYGASRYASGTGTSGPLSPLGFELLRAMEQTGMILDITHLADEAMDQIFDQFGGHVLASHHNCRAFVNRQRQLRDSDIRHVINRGGVIGVALDNWMLDEQCGQGPGNIRRTASLNDVVRHIDHICQLAGSHYHAAIGSDLDGGFGVEQSPLEIDTIADLQVMGELMSGLGFSDSQIEGIMYRNWYDFMKKCWSRTTNSQTDKQSCQASRKE